MNYKPETYQEILDLANGINSAGADKKKAQFSLMIAQDKYALKKHVAFVAAAKEVPEEYEELGKAVAEVSAKHATVAEGGKTRVPDDKWPEFKAELDEFREDPKNKKIEAAYEKQMKFLELFDGHHARSLTTKMSPSPARSRRREIVPRTEPW